MKRRRLLLINTQSLFGAALENLLASEGSIDLKVANEDEELPKLTTTLDEYQPDIIVLPAAARGFQTQELLAMLERRNSLMLLVVNGEENVMHIYTRSTVRISAYEDFFTILRGDLH